MFESAKLKHHVDKSLYKREAPKLRQALLQAQFDLKGKGDFPVLIIIAGVEGAGKSETVNLLNEWMDPRHIVTSAFAEPSDEERERPRSGASGARCRRAARSASSRRLAHRPIVNRVLGEIGEGAFGEHIGEIMRLEKMLADEGVLLLKYWFHLSRRQQEKRLKDLASDRARAGMSPTWNGSTSSCTANSSGSARPSCAGPPRRVAWMVVPGADARYRTLTVARHCSPRCASGWTTSPSSACPTAFRRCPIPPTGSTCCVHSSSTSR